MGKKIEPTDAMVDEAANALSVDGNGTSLRYRSNGVKSIYRKIARVALSVALSHPDAPGLFTDEDARPWEPLTKDAPARVGYEVRMELHGVTRIGVVGRVEGGGEVRTAKGGYIGVLDLGTWYVRRAAPELPTEDEAVIVPADGHKRIEAVSGVDTYFAREAALVCGCWRAAWRAVTSGRVCYSVRPEEITHGTWKVDGE